MLPRLPSSSRSSKVRNAACARTPLSPLSPAGAGRLLARECRWCGARLWRTPFGRGSGRAAAAPRHDAAGSPQPRGRQLGGWAGVRVGRCEGAATSREAGGQQAVRAAARWERPARGPSGGGPRSMGSAPGGPALPWGQRHVLTPRPPSTTRPCRSLSLALPPSQLLLASVRMRVLLARICGDLPSPSRPSAVPARREVGLCFVAALQFVMLYLRVVPTRQPTNPEPPAPW